MSKPWTLAKEYNLISTAFRNLKLDKFQGSWSLEFPGLTIIINITPVKVVVNGKTIIIKRNKNKKYPFSQGWISFQFEGWTYYFKTNGTLTVRINRKGEMVKGKVGKNIWSFDWKPEFESDSIQGIGNYFSDIETILSIFPFQLRQKSSMVTRMWRAKWNQQPMTQTRRLSSN